VDFTRNDRDETILKFTDTGSGMKQEERARLFEPFYTGFSEGRGIGMAVVRRIVDDYSGSIEVSSSEGRGTSLSIILPPTPEPDLDISRKETS
jgi:two-component system sensor histidine kinase PilS (NtrC family)